MLSERERRALEDLERSLADGAECPPARSSPRWRVSLLNRPWPAAVVIGAVCAFLMMEGAGTGGLALAVAAALGWLLARYWRQLRELGDPALLAGDDTAGNDAAPLRPAHPARRHPLTRRRADS